MIGGMTDPSIWREYGTPLLPPLSPGPLDGRTVAVKDLFAVAGFAIGAGNPAWLSQAETEPDCAPAVAALRAAGAAIAGIAQTDELAFSLSGANPHYGTPPNPAAPDRVTGGSSSGPASAVATGQADIGLGTDTAGSVRVPASACGLFGFRPTQGAVPADRVLPLAPSFDTPGWITAGPELLARAGAVLLPPGPSAFPRTIITIDLPNGSPFPSRSIASSVSSATVLSDSELDDLLAAFRAVQSAEAWASHGVWITANPGVLGPDVEARFRFGSTVTAAERARAWKVIAGYRSRVLDLLGDDTWLALPAAGGPGHPRDVTPAEKDAWRAATFRRTVIASAFGLPSVSVPTGASPPEGIALIGPPGADHALLRATASAGPAS